MVLNLVFDGFSILKYTVEKAESSFIVVSHNGRHRHPATSVEGYVLCAAIFRKHRCLFNSAGRLY